MNEINVETLKRWRDEHIPHTLVDIREPYEREVSHIEGLHIPMGEIMQRMDELPTDHPVVIHCRSGSRSAAVTHALTAHGLDNVHNLQGGITAWAERLDPNLEVA